MSYFQSTTDASNLYRPTTATETSKEMGTAVRGNLADQMNNVIIIRTTYMANQNIGTNASFSEQ